MNQTDNFSEKDNLAGAKGKLSRRDFLQTGLKAIGALAALELAGGALIYLRSHTLEGEFGGIITAGYADEFPAGSVTEFEEGNFFLIRDEKDGFMAIYRRCPHLGCTVKWIESTKKFLCPCHAAAFELTGDFENQLVTRALDIFPVSFESGKVKVDTSQVVMREHHRPEDVSYNG
jgi:cytochrome b6-f complex iron-sulfur subunit